MYAIISLAEVVDIGRDLGDFLKVVSIITVTAFVSYLRRSTTSEETGTAPCFGMLRWMDRSGIVIGPRRVPD